MNDVLLGIGIIAVLFILTLMWLSAHPDFMAPPERERPSLEPHSYGGDDPGPLRTEIERRFEAYEPPPEVPGGTGRSWM